MAVTRCRSCGCDLQPWESDFCEGCGPFFLEGKAMENSNAISDAIERSKASGQIQTVSVGLINRQQAAEIRAIVDRAGWQGLREQRPDLWQVFCLQRQRDAQYIDAVLRDS